MLIDHQQCTSFQCILESFQCPHYQLTARFGSHIVGPHLNDTWPTGLCQGKHRPKIQVMRENNGPRLPRPSQNLNIRGSRITQL